MHLSLKRVRRKHFILTFFLWRFFHVSLWNLTELPTPNVFDKKRVTFNVIWDIFAGVFLFEWIKRIVICWFDELNTILNFVFRVVAKIELSVSDIFVCCHLFIIFPLFIITIEFLKECIEINQKLLNLITKFNREIHLLYDWRLPFRIFFLLPLIFLLIERMTMAFLLSSIILLLLEYFIGIFPVLSRLMLINFSFMLFPFLSYLSVPFTQKCFSSLGYTLFDRENTHFGSV